MLQCVIVRCSVPVGALLLYVCVRERESAMLQHVAVCNSMSQFVAVCCSVLQCVAVCYGVLLVLVSSLLQVVRVSGLYM